MGGGGEGLGAGRGGSEQRGGAQEGSGPVTKSFAGGQVEVSRVGTGQPVKAREERDFWKSPAGPPACFPPFPGG